MALFMDDTERVCNFWPITLILSVYVKYCQCSDNRIRVKYESDDSVNSKYGSLVDRVFAY